MTIFYTIGYGFGYIFPFLVVLGCFIIFLKSVTVLSNYISLEIVKQYPGLENDIKVEAFSLLLSILIFGSSVFITFSVVL